MMMENDPMNESLKSLLSDYAAPIPDDGFAQNVKIRIARRSNLRRFMLAVASLAGGIIAGMQIPKMVDVVSGVSGAALPDASMPQLPDFSIHQVLDGFSLGAGAPMLMIAATGICLLWWLGDTALDAL